MENNEIERNSKIFHEKLDECIPPNIGDLPSYPSKEDTVKDIRQFVREHREALPILYRYSPADEYNISALIDGNVYLISAGLMNDTNEGKVWHSCFDKEENNEYKEMMQKNAYLKSFSEDGNSEYMWVNYAENFAGMCVAYDFSHASEDLLKELYPVQYSSVGFQCADNKLALLTPYLFTRKDMKWKYEREWRFIKTKPFNRSKAIPKSVEGCICAVYFGSNMDENLKQEIEYKLSQSDYESNSENRRHIDFYDIEPTITMKKRAEINYGDPNFR